MAQGTGFVNFQKMLGANRPYKERVSQQRANTASLVGGFKGAADRYNKDALSAMANADVYDQFNNFMTTEGDTLAGYQSFEASNPGIDPYNTTRQQEKIDRAQGLYDTAFSGYDPASVENNPYVSASDMGTWEGAGNYGVNAPETYIPITDVNKVGTSGEKALDSAIYGDMYGTTDPSKGLQQEVASGIDTTRNQLTAFNQLRDMMGLPAYEAPVNEWWNNPDGRVDPNWQLYG